jgi:hypothetical protein
MLINLAFIKAVNGLFYYAMDYVADLGSAARVVLVRSPEIAGAVTEHFPHLPVEIASGMGVVRAVMAAQRQGEMVFTPSPHPIPWCSNQLVVVHDSFPFEGAKGRAKALLFAAAMRTSRAKAGFINVADARAFLLSLGLKPARLLATPNKLALPATERQGGSATWPDRARIGLMGTDSPKKNYPRLFSAFASRQAQSSPIFRVYGQLTPYFCELRRQFPQVDLELVDSRVCGLQEFVSGLDMIASAAMREGFSRPVALALALGVPTWLVVSPVYQEFYAGSATFLETPEALGHSLAALAPGDVLPRPCYAPPASLQADQRNAVAWLKAMDGHAA